MTLQNLSLFHQSAEGSYQASHQELSICLCEKSLLNSCVNDLDPEGIASLMNRLEIPIKTILDAPLEKHQLSLILSLLSYADLRGLGDALQEELLGQLSSEKISSLMISSGTIKELPALPSCQTLDCSDCYFLVALPELPLCHTLKCSWCNHLTALPELPSCQILDCSDCDNLSALPALLSCHTLICSYCDSLSAFPELPLCGYLDYGNCPLLANTQLPNLPHHATVIGIEYGDFNKLIFPMDDIAKQPKHYLNLIGKLLLAGKSFPNINYSDSQAIDAGGVRRDFLSRLLEALFSEERNKQQLVRRQGFPEASSDQEQEFRIVGALLAQCYLKTASFVTGPLFHEGVYRFLVATDLFEKALAIQSRDPHIQKIAYGMLDEELTWKTYQEARYYLDPSFENETLNTLEGCQQFFWEAKHQAALRSSILQELLNEPLASRQRALCWMAKEMKQALGSKWTELKTLSVVELQETVEGKLTKELLIKSLCWDQGECLQHELIQTQHFMNEWILGATREELELCVRAITSSNAVALGTKIKINLYRRGTQDIPKAHTCFPSLELSGNYESQEQFQEKFSFLIAQAHEDFQFA